MITDVIKSGKYKQYKGYIFLKDCFIVFGSIFGASFILVPIAYFSYCFLFATKSFPFLENNFWFILRADSLICLIIAPIISIIMFKDSVEAEKNKIN